MPRIVKLTDRIQYLQVSYEPLSADVVAVRGDSAWWIFDAGACDDAVRFINELPRASADAPIVGNAANSKSCSDSANFEGCKDAADVECHNGVASFECSNNVVAPLKKNIVISHFHRDHLLNVVRHCNGEVSLDFDAVFLGSHASKVVGEVAGREKVAVTSPISFDDGVKIQILPMPNSHAKGSLALIVDDYVFLGDATYPMVGHGTPDVYNVQILGEQIALLKSLAPTRFCLSHKRGLVRDKDSVIQFLESVYARRQKNENYIVA